MTLPYLFIKTAGNTYLKNAKVRKEIFLNKNSGSDFSRPWERKDLKQWRPGQREGNQPGRSLVSQQAGNDRGSL